MRSSSGLTLPFLINFERGDEIERALQDRIVRRRFFRCASGPLLRGFGRLDVFPMKDSGAEAGLRKLSGDPDVRVEPIIAALSPQQGMLYYHLLLGRLEAGGQLETAATPLRAAQPRLGSKR